MCSMCTEPLFMQWLSFGVSSLFLADIRRWNAPGANGELQQESTDSPVASASLPACVPISSCMSVCLCVCLYPQGQPKVNESLWQALRSIWRMFTTRLGLVRLNMSQPFSLRVGGAADTGQQVGVELLVNILWGYPLPLPCRSISLVMSSSTRPGRDSRNRSRTVKRKGRGESWCLLWPTT